jgi:CRP-like cAMP-binding protein
MPTQLQPVNFDFSTVFNGTSLIENGMTDDLFALRTTCKNEYVYRPGDATDRLYFLVEGRVKTGTWLENGKEMIKSVLHAGDMFGELGLSNTGTRKDFARAINEDVIYYQLNTGDLQRLIKKHPGLGIKIISQLANRLKGAENKLEARICKTARERIIDFLRERAEQQGMQVGYEILIKHTLTHKEMANLTSTSRQTVTTVLNDLKKSDLIYIGRNSILIRDIEKLE